MSEEKLSGGVDIKTRHEIEVPTEESAPAYEVGKKYKSSEGSFFEIMGDETSEGKLSVVETDQAGEMNMSSMSQAELASYISGLNKTSEVTSEPDLGQDTADLKIPENKKPEEDSGDSDSAEIDDDFAYFSGGETLPGSTQDYFKQKLGEHAANHVGESELANESDHIPEVDLDSPENHKEPLQALTTDNVTTEQRDVIRNLWESRDLDSPQPLSDLRDRMRETGLFGTLANINNLELKQLTTREQAETDTKRSEVVDSSPLQSEILEAVESPENSIVAVPSSLELDAFTEGFVGPEPEKPENNTVHITVGEEGASSEEKDKPIEQSPENIADIHEFTITLGQLFERSRPDIDRKEGRARKFIKRLGQAAVVALLVASTVVSGNAIQSTSADTIPTTARGNLTQVLAWSAADRLQAQNDAYDTAFNQASRERITNQQKLEQEKLSLRMDRETAEQVIQKFAGSKTREASLAPGFNGDIKTSQGVEDFRQYLIAHASIDNMIAAQYYHMINGGDVTDIAGMNKILEHMRTSTGFEQQVTADVVSYLTNANVKGLRDVGFNGEQWASTFRTGDSMTLGVGNSRYDAFVVQFELGDQFLDASAVCTQIAGPSLQPEAADRVVPQASSEVHKKVTAPAVSQVEVVVRDVEAPNPVVPEFHPVEEQTVVPIEVQPIKELPPEEIEDVIVPEEETPETPP
ncbi:hypothetical protein EOL73_03295, partial [Candidatus Saccharibacteria bacterium]|nr:hypothetical protein [Candidatus Saccharibacteria bacterium]